jgi:NlpC/P60 family putative phage cell wall peptidase
MDVQAERARVVAIAHEWIGTPFHHAARLKGVGVDCAQLLLGVFEEAGLLDATAVRAYPPDWFLHEETPHYLEELARFAVPLGPNELPDVGDFALFRYGRAVSHAGILVATGEHPIMVHAVRGVGVILDALETGSAMTVRLVGYWRFARWSAVT